MEGKLSDYHLYGNFSEKFPSNGTSFFFGTGNRNGIELYIFKIPVIFSLSLALKPGTGNPNKWYRKFRSFR